MEKRKIINGESRDYTVDIVSNCGFMSEILDLEEPVFIIDANVHRLYSDRLFQDIPSDRMVLFNAIEMNKTLQGLDGLLKAVLGLSARNKRKTNFVPGLSLRQFKPHKKLISRSCFYNRPSRNNSKHSRKC